MRVAIEMFSIVIAITLGCILFASFISSNNQVSNARDFYNVAVNRIEDSNCNDQVISQCKSEAGEKGYTLEIEDLTIYNEQPSRLVILKYSITMPVFSLFGNGLSKQGVIEGQPDKVEKQRKSKRKDKRKNRNVNINWGMNLLKRIKVDLLEIIENKKAEFKKIYNKLYENDWYQNQYSDYLALGFSTAFFFNSVYALAGSGTAKDPVYCIN